MALHHHAFAHLGDGVGQQRFERGGRLTAEFDQVVFGGGAGGGDRHRDPRATDDNDGGAGAGAHRLRVQCTKAKRDGLKYRFAARLFGIDNLNCYKINHFALSYTGTALRRDAPVPARLHRLHAP